MVFRFALSFLAVKASPAEDKVFQVGDVVRMTEDVGKLYSSFATHVDEDGRQVRDYSPMMDPMLGQEHTVVATADNCFGYLCISIHAPPDYVVDVEENRYWEFFSDSFTLVRRASVPFWLWGALSVEIMFFVVLLICSISCVVESKKIKAASQVVRFEGMETPKV